MRKRDDYYITHRFFHKKWKKRVKKSFAKSMFPSYFFSKSFSWSIYILRGLYWLGLLESPEYSSVVLKDLQQLVLVSGPQQLDRHIHVKERTIMLWSENEIRWKCNGGLMWVAFGGIDVVPVWKTSLEISRAAPVASR